ncbi:IS256 family transposase [Bacillus megaterium]|nr:IS256 family transposase [Priestia megaterium]
MHTEFGELHLVIPRDRNGDFKQQTVAPYKRSNDTLEAFVIHMFQKGVTTAEIAHLMERMYGHHYTPQTISNMTKVMSEQVEAFRDRTLCARYACVYLDATYIALKRDTVSKEAVYIAVGIREDGSKEVLGYTIAPNESAFVWKELLEDIKSRGVEEILLFISDGLKGISDSVFLSIQLLLIKHAASIFHVRLLIKFVYPIELKSVYRAESLEMGQQALDSFIEKWKSKYPKVTKPLLNNSYLFTFYSFPKSIWRSIYSTNLIESFNKQIKKYSKRKEQFPNEESLERFLLSQFDQYNQRFATRCHIGFDQARAELQMMFKTN